ncbi:hypothetical protein D3C85_843050 [compost metagenome]
MKVNSLVSKSIRDNLVTAVASYQGAGHHDDWQTFERASKFFSFALSGYDRFASLQENSLITRESMAVLRACTEVEVYYSNMGDLNYFQAVHRAKRTREQASKARWYGLINSAISTHREWFAKFRFYELVNLLDTGTQTNNNEPVFELPKAAVFPLGRAVGSVETLSLIGSSPLYADPLRSPSLAVKLGLATVEEFMQQGIDCARPLISAKARQEFEDKRQRYAQGV